jgi:RHS repeat-associated protein
VSWLIPNSQGTATTAIDGYSQAVAFRYYAPFGQPRGTAPGSWPGTRGFVGGTTDATTGLTNLGAREYNPANPLFISPDPVLKPDQPTDLNPYGYAQGNPTTYSDPTGLTRPDDGQCGHGGAPACNPDTHGNGGNNGGGNGGSPNGSPAPSSGNKLQCGTSSLACSALAAAMPPWLQFNANHLAAVMGATNGIVAQLQAQGYTPAQILDGLRFEHYIPGASKAGTGNGGFADITFRERGGMTLVWEVKAYAYADQAAAEAQRYAGFLSAQGTAADTGFDIPGVQIMPAPGGEVEVFSKGPRPDSGGILYIYSPTPQRQPDPQPAPSPVPVPITAPAYAPGPVPNPIVLPSPTPLEAAAGAVVLLALMAAAAAIVAM